jgi:predicted Rdx family selenoprotein
LAAEIRSALSDAEVELIPSGGGRFEVVRDGTLIFSKKSLGRHAAPGEILKLLAGASP